MLTTHLASRHLTLTLPTFDVTPSIHLWNLFNHQSSIPATAGTIENLERPLNLVY